MLFQMRVIMFPVSDGAENGKYIFVIDAQSPFQHYAPWLAE